MPALRKLPTFAQVFHKVSLTPTWWEIKLYHLYDCTDWADNLRHCPTVAYSGEIDSQKQAADIMADALKKQGLDLVHIIGPKTKHSYHPQARIEVERRISALAAKGREKDPETVHFTTFTLHYNKCAWITVDALDHHWEQARIEAHRNADKSYTVRTKNIKAFTIELPHSDSKAPSSPVKVQVLPLGQDQAATQTAADTISIQQQLGRSRLLCKERRSLGCGIARCGAPQKTRPAGTDRRRLYGQFSVCPADGESGEFPGCRVGRE